MSQSKPPALVSQKSIELSSPDNKENVDDLIKFLSRPSKKRPRTSSFDLCHVELADMLDFLNS